MQYPMIAQPQYAFAPTMPMMAEGGLVAAAKDVQSRGRNGDSMLVHMTPKEVGGLQALAMAQGGSLSINPQTGLPEANFLKNMLPTILGFGLNFLLPGSGALIGLGVGGLETLRTGDIGKGLMAGLGAYGGANLGASLGAAGAGSAATGAAGAGAAGAGSATTGLEAFADPGFIAETGAGAGAAMSGAPATVGAGAIPVVDPSVVAQGTGISGAGLSGAEMSALKSGAGYGDALSSTETFRQGTTQAGQGFTSLATPEGRSAFVNASGGYGGLATDIGMASAPLIGSALTPKPYDMAPESKEGPNYEGPYTPSERRVSFPDDERRRRSSEFMYFTPSNPVPFAKGGVPTLEDGGFVLTKKAVDGLGGGSNKKGQQVASAGLGAIPIRGKGTGTSDSIRTSIDRKRPARVSNGEAYVPKKQVVKHGGAKKFYDLMRKAERRA